MGNKAEKFQLKPYFDKKKKYISFGGKSEEEMHQKFNSYNIIWYAPEKTEKLENWIAFSNVDVYKAINNEQLFNYLLLNFNNIIIMTGKFAEKLFSEFKIKILEQLSVINFVTIIIYCQNSEYHKKWSKNHKEISAITTKPKEIFDILLKYQKDFYGDICLFGYKINDKKTYNFNYYYQDNNIFNQIIDDEFSLKLNFYEKYCLNIVSIFNLISKRGQLDFYDFRCCFHNIINIFYGFTIDDMPYSPIQQMGILNPWENMDGPPKTVLNFLEKLALISFSLCKFPYLYGCLNYKEIEERLNEKITIYNLREKFEDICSQVNILFDNLYFHKILDLNNNEHLKKVHYFLIDFIKIQTEFNLYSRYPLIIKYLMDLDFCMKYFYGEIINLIDFSKFNYFKQQIKRSLPVDKRISIFNEYINMNLYEQNALKIISKDELKSINDIIKINEFIVIGNKGFHKKIKGIKNNLNNLKEINIGYLVISEVREYLKMKINEKEKVKVKNSEKEKIKDRNFNYILIIELDEMQKLFKEIYSIKKEFALTLIIIVYSQKENVLINKNIFQIPYIPIFLANSTQEIINYINSQNYINFASKIDDFNEKCNSNPIFTNIWLENKINDEKIDENNDDLDIEDDWEILENIPKDIFQKILFQFNWEDSVSDIRMNILKMIKENDIGNNPDKKYEKYKYLKYFGFTLFPESKSYLIDIFVKQFCHAYTKGDSFYYILNKELKNKDSSKANKYLELISLINTAIEQKAIKSFKGKVYRGTYIQNEIINNILIEGKIVANLAFFSTSKDKGIAKKFLSRPKNNVYFKIETNENNIDIDLEHISYFKNEKEVLFIPYSKFLVEKKKKKLFTQNRNEKEFYKIKLKGLDNNHERNNIRKTFDSGEIMNIINTINSIY